MKFTALVKELTTGLAQKAKAVETTAAADLAKAKALVTIGVTDAETIVSWAQQLLAGKVPVTNNATLNEIFGVIVKIIPFIPNLTEAALIADLTEAMGYLNDASAFIALL